MRASKTPRFTRSWSTIRDASSRSFRNPLSRQQAARSRQKATSYYHVTAYCLLPTAYCLLPAACCLLPARLPAALLLPFLRPRALQHVEQPVVALVARVLVELLVGRGHRNPTGKRARERRGVVNGELVRQRVGIDTRELLDETQVLGGSHLEAARADASAERGRLVGEVRRLDDERVSFPMSA